MPGSGRPRGLKTSLKRDISESKSMQRGISDSSSRRDLVQRGISNSSHPDDENVEVNSETFSSRASSSTGTRPTKRVRGPTRGLALAKRRDEDFDIVISNNRIVGNDSAPIISEIGIVMRDNAPFNVQRWKDVPPDDQNKMWEMIRDKFRLPDDIDMKNAVMTQLNKDFRNYRSNQHVYHFKPHGSMERALQHCPRDMQEDRWRDLCLSFTDEHFQKLSVINSGNRAKQTILHASGSKGYHRLEYELRDKETNDPPPMKLLWHTSHYNSKTGKWASEAAKNVYDEVESRIKAKETEGVTTNDADIFLEVLGHRSGYIRGRGAGPKPTSSHARRKDAERDQEVAKARKESEEARREAEEARKEASALKEQLSILDQKLQALTNFVLQRGSN